jgi:Fur family peroxide stress response transcriptional regulator
MTAQARYERLRATAKRRGLRLTPQRDVLLRVLGAMPHHPTAEEVFRRVSKSLSSVSPATVYRNLQILAGAGVISPLERAGASVRYDPNPDEHHHFVCKQCGSVSDVYLLHVGYRVDVARSRLGAARVQSCELQLHGLCARCQDRM